MAGLVEVVDPPRALPGVLLDAVVTLRLRRPAPEGLRLRLLRAAPGEEPGAVEIDCVQRLSGALAALCPLRKLDPSTQYTLRVDSPGEEPYTSWFSTRGLCCIHVAVQLSSAPASSRERLEAVFSDAGDPMAELLDIVSAHYGRQRGDVLSLVGLSPTDGVQWPIRDRSDVAQLETDDAVLVAFRPSVSTRYGRGVLCKEREDGSCVVKLGWERPVFAYLRQDEVRPTTLPPMAVAPEYFLGRDVAVDFGPKFGVFGGRVTEYEPQKPCWTVVFADGSSISLGRRTLELAVDLRAMYAGPGRHGRKRARTVEAVGPRGAGAGAGAGGGGAGGGGSAAANKARRITGGVPALVAMKSDPDHNLRVDEFLVERILSQRRSRPGVEEFLVKWAGLPASEVTWEPLQNLTGCEAALEAFRDERGGWL